MSSSETLGHYMSHWGESYRVESFTRGPARLLPPDFAVVRFDCIGTLRLFVYATVGLGNVASARLEAFLCSPYAHEENTEIMYSLAFFHLHGESLGLNHTVNFGKPWLPGSTLTHGLLCRPYIFGPSIEAASVDGEAARILWLLPITVQEKQYAVLHGAEALERIFERESVNYTDPKRWSLV